MDELILTADELYAECLGELDGKRQQLLTVDNEEEKVEIEESIQWLSQESIKRQKKANLKELNSQPQMREILIQTVARKQKHFSLLKLKTLAADRQYLSSLMKKYAEGQAIGVRISKQFTSNYNKIQKEVQNFNTITNKQFDVKTFLSPTSDVFDELHSTRLNDQQQKAIQAATLQGHARDESNMIYMEIQKLFTELSHQSIEIRGFISNILSTEVKSRASLGKLQYYYCKHFNIEMLLDSCSTLFEDISIDECLVPRIVHELIARHLYREQELVDLPSEEEMRTILEEIENIENCEVNSGNVDDDDDEDDDDDDDDNEDIDTNPSDVPKEDD